MSYTVCTYLVLFVKFTTTVISACAPLSSRVTWDYNFIGRSYALPGDKWKYICVTLLTWPFLPYLSYEGLCPGKYPWALKHNSQIWPPQALTQRYNFRMFVWRLLHWPLKMWYMGAYLGVGTCPGHYSIALTAPCKPLQLINSIIIKLFWDLHT